MDGTAHCNAVRSAIIVCSSLTLLSRTLSCYKKSSLAPPYAATAARARHESSIWTRPVAGYENTRRATEARHARGLDRAVSTGRETARRETSMRICAVDSLCAAPRIQEQQRGDADGAPPHHHRDGIGEVCLRAREHHLCASERRDSVHKQQPTGAPQTKVGAVGSRRAS